MYGPCKFDDVCWTTELTYLAEKLPSGLEDSFMNRIFDEQPVPIQGGVSLEGQAPGPPDFTDPRQAYAMTRVARGQVIENILQPQEYQRADPLKNISTLFPPTFIVHGTADTMVPISVSRALFAELQKNYVICGMAEIPGEEHTFSVTMQVGSRTWDLQRQGFDFLQSLIR